MKIKSIVSALISTSLISSSLYADEPVNMGEAPNKIIIGEGEAQNTESIKDAFDTASGVETDGDSLTFVV